MARAPSAALVVAEGAAPSLGSAPSRLKRSPLSALSARVQEVCLQTLATPTVELMSEAKRLLDGLLDMACLCLSKALSPYFSLTSRKIMATNSRLALEDMLLLLDAVLRVPPRLLLLRWPEQGARFSLRCVVANVIGASMTYDRAAAELGMEPFDGGPFACEGLALPGGAR